MARTSSLTEGASHGSQFLPSSQHGSSPSLHSESSVLSAIGPNMFASTSSSVLPHRKTRQATKGRS